MTAAHNAASARRKENKKMEITTTIKSDNIDELVRFFQSYARDKQLSPAQLDMAVIAALTAIHFFNGSQGVKIGSKTLGDLKVKKQ